MSEKLSELDWDMLLDRIQDGKCTPFLGAGVNGGILPLGSKLSETLAKKYDYPLEECSDLAKVTQFLAVTVDDAMFPKEKVLGMLKVELEKWKKTVTLADFFEKQHGSLGVLAELPIPIYMTTNYDNLMFMALQSWKKDPKRELCRWNKFVKDKKSLFDSDFEPTAANPVVFHLHGHDEIPESLVLTEDDYLDFLVNISREQILPSLIQEAIAGTSLLFMGYRLADWNFRVLFRGIINSMEGSLRRISIAVQLPREQKSEQVYLTHYFGNIKVKVYWGTAEEFAKELRDRWRAFKNGE